MKINSQLNELLLFNLNKITPLRKREVRRAYNRKEKSYVVLPYGHTNKRLLKKAYFEATGEELEITA